MDEGRIQALANVIVFTPLLAYSLRNRQPPGWLIAASVAYAGFTLVRDFRYLIERQDPAAPAPTLPPNTVSRLTTAADARGTKS